MSRHDPLARALIVRAISRQNAENPPVGVSVGAALAALRADVLLGVHDDHPAARNAPAVRKEIMGLGVGAMPPDTDLVAILLETASQRAGGVGWAQIWQAIGMTKGRGRDLLARTAQALDWPVWYTLREHALATEPREMIVKFDPVKEDWIVWAPCGRPLFAARDRSVAVAWADTCEPLRDRTRDDDAGAC